MLDKARDIAAVIFYEKQLSLFREDWLEQAVQGKVPDEDAVKKGEEEALRITRTNYYTDKVRQAVKPDQADGMSDDEDFKDRSQTLAEQAILMTHRKLMQIPYHGQEEYKDV